MEATYQPFDPDDSEETPQDSGVMIHIVPESGKGNCLLCLIGFG